MARPKPLDSVRIPIGLKVSEADAARIDEVLTRPEFVGWSRAEWCREIIRSALRYYVGDDAAPDPDQARAPARPAAPQSVSPSQPPVGSPAADVSGPAISPSPTEPVLTVPEPPVQPECPHPAGARDYQTGTCAACGAVLWD
jgi:hypothetical protein